MFIFEKEQLIYDIGGIRIGGNPGETPTALAGTIFYAGDKIVRDAKKGDFDKSAAETLLNDQDTMAEVTGNPALVQIFSESTEALRRYIDYVSEITNAPFLIDSTDPMVRIDGLVYTEEIGLMDKAIYNSLNLSASLDEITALTELQHDCAILLAFNPRDPTVAGRRAVLEDGVGELKKGLLPLSEELGITKPLIDTATTAMGAGAGTAVTFIFVSKTLYGYPTGSGIHNAPSSWTWLRELKKTNKEAFKTCDISSNLLVQALGADYILYGPIKNANRVFPAVAMTDVFAAESLSLEMGIEPVEDHPYHKLL
ncbi:MAG: tetrahydromethanopterin S-methyltransferase subunit H [Candidatus Thorarchaeota archaeon]